MRDRPKGKGFIPCPKCGSSLGGVGDSRPRVFNGIKTISRRRECENCGERFRTIEVTIDLLASIRSVVTREIKDKIRKALK